MYGLLCFKFRTMCLKEGFVWIHQMTWIHTLGSISKLSALNVMDETLRILLRYTLYISVANKPTRLPRVYQLKLIYQVLNICYSW